MQRSIRSIFLIGLLILVVASGCTGEKRATLVPEGEKIPLPEKQAGMNPPLPPQGSPGTLTEDGKVVDLLVQGKLTMQGEKESFPPELREIKDHEGTVTRYRAYRDGGVRLEFPGLKTVRHENMLWVTPDGDLLFVVRFSPPVPVPQTVHVMVWRTNYKAVTLRDLKLETALLTLPDVKLAAVSPAPPPKPRPH